MVGLNASIHFLICWCCICFVDCNSTSVTKCFWFPIHNHHKTTLELLVNVTLCKYCGQIQNSYQTVPFCKTDDMCEQHGSDTIDLSFDDNVQVLQSAYGTMALNALVFAIHAVPDLFGNVTSLFIANNSLCMAVNPSNLTQAVTGTFTFDGDVDQWFYLEYVRPMFSSWLVLNISLYLRRYTAGRATRHL
uniref:GP3 n=1 Tax=Bamboo rat arterivirus TaxID=3038165 RepID=A0AAT9TWQ1_9NIDO|nr:GP3 [Bamboo rat arterivirus]WFD49974.1 GP3 [Bamboo rat arterivirus]WFG83238.1 GP3 [Arteriviridae sp.]WFG95398.1 GP3 [Arteriviridae sp.]